MTELPKRRSPASPIACGCVRLALDQGQTLVEYALVTAVLVLGCALAIGMFGLWAGLKLDEITSSINNGQTAPETPSASDEVSSVTSSTQTTTTTPTETTTQTTTTTGGGGRHHH